MDLTKEVFTTSEAAKLCHANISSIKNWIEQGRLQAFRTPGGHHRIERQSLGTFLDNHGMPNPFTAQATRRVLLIGHVPLYAEALKRAFSYESDVVVVENDVRGLMTFGQWNPDYVVASQTPTLELSVLCEQAAHIHPDCVLICMSDAKEGHHTFCPDTSPEVVVEWVQNHEA